MCIYSLPRTRWTKPMSSSERCAFYSNERERFYAKQRRSQVPVTKSHPSGGLDDEAMYMKGANVRLQDTRGAKPWKQTASADGVHLYEFQNQLRTVLVPLPANNVVSFSIVYLVGSNAETSSQYGVSFFVLFCFAFCQCSPLAHPSPHSRCTYLSI